MINPILFSIHIGSFNLAIHWYGIIVMLALSISIWLASRELERRGGDPNWILDSMIYVLIAGVIGARLWFVVNNIVGGGTQYLNDPLSILNIPAGGLHIYGAFLFGGIAFFVYARQKKLDLWLLMDSIAPFMLIGQALGRPANFINQELYGPPTTLPWGIPIDASHRLPAWSNLAQYPVATTRFTPTFAYEMLWNFAAAGLLLWLARRFGPKLRPGTIFFGWMVLAGIGRAIMETWRPDQPIIPGLGMTTTSVVALLIALVGGILLLGRYNIIPLPFWKEQPEASSSTPG